VSICAGFEDIHEGLAMLQQSNRSICTLNVVAEETSRFSGYGWSRFAESELFTPELVC